MSATERRERQVHWQAPADIAEALEYAEHLLEAVDRQRQRYRVLRAAQGTLFLLGALGAVLTLFLVQASFLVHFISVVIFAVASIAGAATLQPILQESVRCSTRDERVMIEIINIVRELLPFLAEDGGWSQPRYRVIRERVTRFPIAQ